MADDAANAVPNDNEQSDSTTPPAKITPDRLAQVPYDPNHALNTFLNLANESDRPFNGVGPMESLEERIRRLQPWVQELEAQVGSRKEQSHPR
ncbi:hypothetical protein ACHAPE_004579 [Trichoderma viride]